MANKSKKVQTAPKPQAKAPAKEPITKKKIVIISVSAFLALAITVGFIIGLVAIVKRNDTVDYLNDDLSKYVYISDEDYKNYPVGIPLVEFSESDVLREINKLLVKNKNKTAAFEGMAVHKTDHAIALGDIVNIWYRGYTLDENGIKHDISGASNFKDGVPYALEIGSGTFIKGIEEGLVGKYLQANSLKYIGSGTVNPTDVIYISYNAFLADGTTQTGTDVRIDLTDRSVDERFGNGFAKFFVGKTIGEIAATNKTFRLPNEEIDTVYYDIKVNYAIKGDENPYVIKGQFSADYHEESLRGLEVIFDVYASTAVIYGGVPEYNDAFVSDTLKESADSLSSYEGQTLSEKYKNKVREELIKDIEERNDALIEEKMWEHYLSKVTVKELPETDVNAQYRQYFREVQLQYSINNAGYETFDGFARYYFGLNSLANWRNHITKKAEEAITEKLVFYYILRQENLIPSDDEYDTIYNDVIDEHMEYYKELYKKDLDACKTEEEKAEKLAEIKKKMFDFYGDVYFEELVYYRYAIDALIDFAAA